MEVKFVFFGLYLCFFSVQGSLTNRLQRDAIPKSYSLTLIPDIDNKTYVGEVTIIIEIQHSMKSILLNSRDLVINEATLDQAIGKTKYKLIPSLELLQISYADQDYINPGEHILNIKFQKSLENHLGFYSRKFQRNNQTHTVLATKFSSIHARSAFPCFDEPFFRSIFNVRLVKPNNTWTALSNMKEINSFNTSNGIAVDFQSTLPMSTYLLSWFLTDYSYDEINYKRQNGEISMRFFTAEDRAGDRGKLLKMTASTLRFFENYTGIEYPLSKLDSIEVPEYRSMGMEHWGMIAYREDGVTYNPAYIRSPLESYIDASLLIAHEVSHMWFGDLVTHEWYNDLWLTEGFARYFQFKALASILKEPSILSMLQYRKLINLHDIQCGFQSWFAAESVFFATNVHDITRQFMGTTYEQGAAVLMMLESVMEAENFQKAIRKHLEKNQYRSSTTGNFINTIQSVVPDMNVRGFIETYLYQKKFPMVHVEETGENFVLTQTPICGTETSIFGNRWTIPIKYITSSNRTARFIWFDKDITKLIIPKTNNDRWIKINHLNQALYRTKYSDSLMTELEADYQTLEDDDKGSLLQDTFILASFRNISCSIPLRLISNLRNDSEMDLTTFNYASNAITNFLSKKNFSGEIRALLNSYLMQILESFQQKFSWTVAPDETLVKRLLRINLLKFLCEDLDYKLCVKDVEKIKNEQSLPHKDVEYLYRAVSAIMKAESKKENERNAQNLNTTEVGENTTTVITPPLIKDEDECSKWIRENIPKLIEQNNQI